MKPSKSIASLRGKGFTFMQLTGNKTMIENDGPFSFILASGTVVPAPRKPSGRFGLDVSGRFTKHLPFSIQLGAPQ